MIGFNILQKSRIQVIILACFAFLLVACTSQETATPEPQPEAATAIPNAVGEGRPIPVGVLSNRSAVATNAQFGPVINYLTETTGRQFELVPLPFDTLFNAVEQGTVEFVLANPLSTVQLQRLYDTSILTTLSRNNTGTQFSGLIITRNDEAITGVEDMRGKTAACINFATGAGGCLFQVFHLLEQGFDPFTDFASFVENPSQDNIVLGVLNGTYDVGFIRTGQLERMVRDEMIFSIDEALIIDSVEDDFYFPHTTILYPEWGFAALTDTDAELIEIVQTTLVGMPSDYPGIAENGLTGFELAADYQAMEDLIISLELFSSDTTAEATESSD